MQIFRASGYEHVHRIWRKSFDQVLSPQKNIAAFTHHGTREGINQDGFVMLFGPRKIMAVADGMGGAPAGDIACQIALETFDKGIRTDNLTLELAMQDGHREILKAAQKNPELKDMGTTLLAAEIDIDCADTRWCGDSRAYLISREGEVGLLTEDQNMATLVYASHHSLTYPLRGDELAEYHEFIRSFSAPNPLTYSLGQSHFFIDSTIHRLQKGDRILLATDGLGFLPLAEFAEIVGKRMGLVETVNELFQKTMIAMQRMVEAGGIGDNITILLYEHED
jgi:serine/threonine protein phosphatase PrpC